MTMRIEDINKQFGVLLKERRTSLHLSQQEFGSRVDLSRASIANIERGEQGISLEQLYAFSKALNTTPENLIPQFQRQDLDTLSAGALSLISEMKDRAKEMENA